MEGALNKIAKNEFMLAVQEVRRLKLLDIANEYEKEEINKAIKLST
jgi:hypothetical protein